MTTIGSAVGLSSLSVADANVCRCRSEQRSIEVIPFGSDAMRPGVIRADGHPLGRTLSNVEKQAIVSGGSDALIFGKSANQLSGALGVNQRQNPPAIGICSRGAGRAAGCLERESLRETVSIRVCGSGEID